MRWPDGHLDRGRRLLRRLIALLAGLLLIVVGVIDQEEAFAAVDFMVIFLLAGMMVLAGALGRTGFFTWLTIRSVRLSRGDPLRLLIILCTVTAVLSAPRHGYPSRSSSSFGAPRPWTSFYRSWPSSTRACSTTTARTALLLHWLPDLCWDHRVRVRRSNGVSGLDRRGRRSGLSRAPARTGSGPRPAATPGSRRRRCLPQR